MSKARESSQRVACAAGQRMIALAANVYANGSNKAGAFCPTSGGGSDNLAWLVNELETPEAAVCPGTRHNVDPTTTVQIDGTVTDRYGNRVPVEGIERNPHGRPVPLDLMRNAVERAITDSQTDTGDLQTNSRLRGHSYEIFAWYGQQAGPFGQLAIWPDGTRRLRYGGAPPTQEQITRDFNRSRGFTSPGTPGYLTQEELTGSGDNFTPGFGQFDRFVKRLDNATFPSQMLLTLDSDEDQSSLVWRQYATNEADSPVVNNWPDEETGNHKASGVNISFVDGHVEFLRPNEELLKTYLRSRHVGLTGVGNNPNNYPAKVLDIIDTYFGQPGSGKPIEIRSTRLGRNPATKFSFSSGG